MAIIKTEGIILRSQKYSESSLILDIYTELLGLRSYIISGVRKPKTKIAGGIFQVTQIIDIVAYDKSGDQLCRIKEAKISRAYNNLIFDVQRSSIGMLITEITRNAIKEKEENPPLYQFLKEWFIHLDNCQGPLGFKPVQFLIDFTRFLGFFPNSNYSSQNIHFNMYEGHFVESKELNQYCCSEAVSQALIMLLNSDKEQNEFPDISNAIRATLFNELIVYYQLHMTHFNNLKSISILRQVLI